MTWGTLRDILNIRLRKAQNVFAYCIPLWGRLRTCSGLPTRFGGVLKSQTSAVGNRAQDSILPHTFVF